MDKSGTLAASVARGWQVATQPRREEQKQDNRRVYCIVE